MNFTHSLAGILVFAAALSAQTISPPIPITTITLGLTQLKQYLNLTDSQVASLNSIAQQKVQAQTQISTQIAEKNQTLQTLLASPSPNPATVGQTLIDIHNLEAQLSVPTTEPYHSQALAVLNPAQTTLLANLNTALQLQTPACEAVSANLIVQPSPSTVPLPLPSGGTIASAIFTPSCAGTSIGIVPVITPALPVTLPGGVVPGLPAPGQ